MLPYLFFFLLSTAIAANCTYEFDGRLYSRTSVLIIDGLPTNLAYDPMKGDIYFTLVNINSLENKRNTEMQQYVLRDGKPSNIIINIKLDEANRTINVIGQAAAIDSKTGKVYIATDNGLLIFNETDPINDLSLSHEDFVLIFKPATKNVLYLVDYPGHEVYMIDLDKNEKTKIDNVPCALLLAVDSKDNIYYECESKHVQVLLKDFVNSIKFAGIGSNMARAVTVDKDDRVILAANDGLYHLSPDNVIPKKLMNLDFVPSGIAFGDDNIYISTKDIIYEFSAKEC